MKTFVHEVPKEFPVSKLQLDPNNPRLRLYPGGTGDKEIIERLCRLGGRGSPGLVVKHFKTDRGFMRNEAPVVFLEPGKKSKLVIDGNRRVAALKMILDPSLIPSTLRGLRNDCESLKGLVPDKIRCWVTDNVSDAKRIVYRAHNEGTKEWESLAKYSTYYDYYYHDGQTIAEVAEFTGGSRAQISKHINTWVLVEFLMRNITNFQIDGSGITSFERVTTSYSEFHRRIGIKLNEEGIYIMPQSKVLAELVLKIFNNSAKADGLSREVENNDNARAAWIDRFVPRDFKPEPDGSPPTSLKPSSLTQSKASNSSPSASPNKVGPKPDYESTARQVLSLRKNVGRKANEIFKEYTKLVPIHDFPIASAALTRAMIETTLKHHAKRLGCYSETTELQMKKHSEALDAIANNLKKHVNMKGLPFSADLVAAISASVKGVADLNDVMHKDGAFAARSVVRSSLDSLTEAVSQLVKIN